jgi:ABC-type glycerol-3-phosphate transport system substrate-binding protein
MSSGERAQWNGVFETLRRGEAVWGDNFAAVPFGSPLFVCYCRADLLEKLKREPPQTWTEYLDLARLLADRERFGDVIAEDATWQGTLEPLGPGWGGLMLLARAAPYAKHGDN